MRVFGIPVVVVVNGHQHIHRAVVVGHLQRGVVGLEALIGDGEQGHVDAVDVGPIRTVAVYHDRSFGSINRTLLIRKFRPERRITRRVVGSLVCGGLVRGGAGVVHDILRSGVILRDEGVSGVITARRGDDRESK